MFAKQDWDWLVINSHYQTALAVREALKEGKIQEVCEGLNALIEAMEKSEKLAIKSQLTTLMTYVIKWKLWSAERCSDWALNINRARGEIEDSQEEVPCLGRDFIESIWEKHFSRAKEYAEMEMGKDCDLISLSWEEVFEEEYSLIK
ncbi:MAG: DUF29 domain-containing protein [Okeania sp. SIO2H7]|nr:DUF29 domain-containing protein [Okeania sp. SIO2H7]